MSLSIRYCRLSAAFVLLISSSSVLAAEVCSSAAADPDGDGWGWENNDSCIVVDPADATPTAPPAGSTAAADGGLQGAICSSAIADTDGDGWGWENNASCVVASGQSMSEQTDTGNTVATVSSNGTNVCSSSAADEDGDGWGWENNDSCVVQSGTVQSGNQAVVTATTPITDNSADNSAGNGSAICSSAAADEDGDGWGWENNNSCVVDATATPASPTGSNTASTPDVSQPAQVACSSPSIDTDNDGYGWENGQSCVVNTPARVRIMAVGDSITHGSGRTNAESYRKPFNNFLSTGNCQYEAVGSQTGNHFHNSFVSPHEGYNGHTADQMLNGHSDDAGNNEGITVTVNRYQPHVVLLHIGSNDMRLGQNIDQTVSEIDQIIAIALAAESQPFIFVANVIPWYGNSTIRTQVELLGDKIEAYVAQLNNPRVKIVDVRGGYQPSMMIYDQVHPNPAGEQHIAERYFAAYEDAGFCR